MSIKIIKRGVVQALYKDVPKNLNRYITADFDDLLFDEYIRDVKDTDFDQSDVVSLCSERGGSHDAENAFIVYNSLKGMTPYLARDERVWVYLTHVPCLEFTRKRWLRYDANEEDIINDIRSHFFARIGGSRAFERNNSVASLWWWAFVSNRYENAPLERTLEAFLTYTDLRSSIIERPTTSRSTPVFSAIMDVVFKRMYSEPNPEFFKRRSNRGIYREWLKAINRHGGIRLYDARAYEDLSELFEALAVSAEQNAVAQ